MGAWKSEGFLRKRAPVYAALIGVFLIFALPGVLEDDLEDLVPELPGEDGRALDAVMAYSGPDGEGLSILQALDGKLTERFGEDVYGDAEVSAEVSGESVVMVFEAGPESIEYRWMLGDDGEVRADNTAAKSVLDTVLFYD